MSRRKKNNQRKFILLGILGVLIVTVVIIFAVLFRRESDKKASQTYSEKRPWHTDEERQNDKVPETKALDDEETRSAQMPEAGTPMRFVRFNTVGSFGEHMIVNGEAGIEIRNADNEAIQQINVDGQVNNMVSDGSSLYFSVNGDEGHGLFKGDIQSGSCEPLLSEADKYITVEGANDKYIFFTSYTEEMWYDPILCTYRMETGEVREIAKGAGDITVSGSTVIYMGARTDVSATPMKIITEEGQALAQKPDVMYYVLAGNTIIYLENTNPSEYYKSVGKSCDLKGDQEKVILDSVNTFMWNALDESRVCYVEMLDGMSYGDELSILDVGSGEVVKYPWGDYGCYGQAGTYPYLLGGGTLYVFMDNKLEILASGIRNEVTSIAEAGGKIYGVYRENYNGPVKLEYLADTP